jgi:hypothetical protein
MQIDPIFLVEEAAMASESAGTSWLQQFWQGSIRRLVGLARQRLHGAVRRAADEEDVEKELARE